MVTQVDTGSSRKPVRFSPSLLVAIAGALIGLYVANSNDLQSIDGYGLGQAVVANEITLYMSSFLAAAACIEALGIRRFWNLWVVERNASVVIAHRLLPIIVTGYSGLLVSYGWFLLIKPPATGSPGFSVPMVGVITVATSIIFGLALGLVLRPVLALPVAVMLPFLFLNLPHSFQIAWPRHLTGSFIDCCVPAFTLDSRPVAASTVFLLTVSLSSGVAVWARTRSPGRTSEQLIVIVLALVGIVGLVSVSLAISLVRDLDYSPAIPRTVQEQVCVDGLCLWPEDERFRQTNTEAWAQVSSAWEALGLPPLEDTPVGGGPDSPPDQMIMRTDDPDFAIRLLSQGLPSAASGCEPNLIASENQQAFDQLSAMIQEELGQYDDLEADQLGESTSPLDPTSAVEIWETIEPCR